MKTNIRPWGNSQGLYIPKDFLRQLGLEVYDSIEMLVEGDSIVIRKSADVERKSAALENLRSLRGSVKAADYKDAYLEYIDERYLND